MTSDLLSQLVDYEEGILEENDVLALFKRLVDTGLAWELQGSYGRTAMKLLELRSRRGGRNPPTQLTQESSLKVETPMFAITRGRGFHLTFSNGWTASVQFGVGNYCEHHDDDAKFGSEQHKDMWSSYDAEVAAWPRKGKLIQYPNGDTVRGWLDADQVLAFLNEIAAKKE